MPTDEENITTHPSFAQIKAARVHSSKPVAMYGSAIRHGHYIILEISESEEHRQLNRYWHHDRKQIIQVRMSETQFAQFVTSLNIGGGTTCTIERRDGKGVEEPPYVDRTQLVKTEFEKHAKLVAKTLANAEARMAELLKPGAKVTKAELTLLKEDIERAAREIGSNMPYMSDSFEEAMAETVGEAKGTIEAFMMDAAAKAGLSQSRFVTPGEQLLSIDPPDTKTITIEGETEK